MNIINSYLSQNRLRQYLPQVLLLLAVIVFFLPVLHFGFVWDDHSNINENYLINPPVPSNVFMFWLKPYNHLYAPITYSFWLWLAHLSESLYGDISPLPFHVASLILHCLNTLLVFKLISRIAQKRFTAFIGALIFAIHPIQIESVTWIIEQRTLLATFFGLLSINLYLARLNPISSGLRKALFYRLSFLFFILAVLSKPSAVVIPIFLLLLHRTQSKDEWIKILKSVSPWFVVALILSLITVQLQTTETVNSIFAQKYMAQIPPLWSRLVVWGDTNFFYLYKILVPVHLSPLYGRTPAIVLSEWTPYLKLLLMVGLLMLAWLQRRRHPHFSLGVALFLVGILPVSGIVPFYFQVWSTVADRYTYLSMCGISILVVAFLDGRYRRFTLPLTALMIITWSAYGRIHHLNDFRDDLSLWSRAVETCGDECPRAYYNLAFSYSNVHDNSHALTYFSRWLDLYRYGSSLEKEACANRKTLTARYECILDGMDWYEKTEHANVASLHIYVLLELGRTDDAENYLQATFPELAKEKQLDYFCKMYGDKFPIYFVKRAEWLLSNGDREKAVGDLERILNNHYGFDSKLYPHVAQAMNEKSFLKDGGINNRGT